MRKIQQGKLSVFKFNKFKQYKEIAHFITTKEGWLSGDKPRFTGDDEKGYKNYRKELSHSCEWPVDRFVFPRQAHSDVIEIVTDQYNAEEVVRADALITKEKDLFICVQTADCVPILLFDPEKNVAAAVHSGWRGTVSRIVGKTVNQMHEAYGCIPSDLIVGIGPSIHRHVYKVGEDVISEVRKNFTNASDLLNISHEEGKAHFDLWEANKTILIESGVKEENIEVMGLCSYEHHELFFSARREGKETGRIVSGIRLK